MSSSFVLLFHLNVNLIIMLIGVKSNISLRVKDHKVPQVSDNKLIRLTINRAEARRFLLKMVINSR